MKANTDGEPSELWRSCAQVMAKEKKPLELWRVATATGQTEDEVIAALIRESRRNRTVCFRFPPLPRAAITHLGMPYAAAAADTAHQLSDPLGPY